MVNGYLVIYYVFMELNVQFSWTHVSNEEKEPILESLRELDCTMHLSSPVRKITAACS